MTKNPLHKEKFIKDKAMTQKHHQKVKKRIADRLMIGSWRNYSHPTDIVDQV